MYNKRLAIIIILYCITLSINYVLILNNVFNYSPFIFNIDGFHLIKLFFIILSLMFLLAIYSGIKNELSKMLWLVLLMYIYIPEAIYYIFNKVSFFYVLIWALFLLFSPFLYNMKFSDKFLVNKFLMNKRNLNYFLLVVTVFGFILFFYKYRFNISISTLLFEDLYEMRDLLLGSQNVLLAYLKNPLIRVLVPILIIVSLERKKYIVSVIGILIAIYLFLTTAVKSDLMIIPILLFFFITKFNKNKDIILSLSLLLISCFSIFEYIFIKSYNITDFIIRRVFFVPPMLNHIYFEYYENNFLVYSQSKVFRLLSKENSDSIPLFIGEKVLLQKDLIANVGIFTDGYINFGIIGILFSFIFLVLLIQYLNKYDFNIKYFGILVVFIYVLNTSFFEPLFLTHGFLIFLVIVPFLRDKV